jgi:hypothetical protein
MRLSRLLPLGALVLGLSLANSAQAAITITNGFNASTLVLNADPTVNLAGSATGVSLLYSAVVPLNLENNIGFDSAKLNDGNFSAAGVYIPTTNDVINTTPPLTGSFDLNFGSTQIVGELAVNLGFGNRHAGDYTIRDGAGTIRGQFTSSGPTATSFFAAFNAPFSTDKLTVDFAATGNGAEGFSASFTEIQVFQGVPEPSCLALLGLGVLGFRRRRG